MEIKDDIINNLLCMACLCVGRVIRKVDDEQQKKFYLEALQELPLNNINIVPRVCWECDATLSKVLSFREQVKDCYRILQTYTENLHDCSLLDISRPPRLKVHTNSAVVITPGEEDFVKLESKDKEKIEKSSENPKTDSSYKGPVEDIQTVLCDVKRDRRKKKNNLKTSSKVTRRKRMTKKDIDPVAVSENYKKIDNENVEKLFIKVETNFNDRVKVDDDVKIEIDNHDVLEDNLSNEGSLKSLDSDDDVMGDIDTQIQTFLDDIKKNKDKSTKVKKKKKIKKVSKPQNILTVDLSYDEMQRERSLLCRRESYVQAQYKCESCLLVFNCATSLRTHHVKKHKVDGDYICSICQTIVSSLEAFTAHYKRHMRRYECAICHKSSVDIKSIQQHLHTRHQITVKKYKCKSCGMVSKSLDKHRYHCDKHKSRVQCPQCDKTFSHRAGLMNHRLAVHESQNQFPCTLCDKVFRWKTSLKRHLDKHNTQENNTASTNKAYCEDCDIGFSSVCSLQRHLRNSLKHVTYDQLKFICDHCGHRFVDKTKLRDHIEEKHLYRTFQCHICHKPSKNRVGLEQHVRTVHKGRPNNRICHHCGKGFPTKVQLESHIRTHTGERPFMCEYCPVTFSQQSNLYKHHRQVHLNMKSKRYPLCKKSKADGNQTGDPQPTFPIAIMQYVPENTFTF
ncbi:zinc finger protein 845-like [Maniola jurtina]|uniref:zinc finger protein 845-like n=1 Tax=Maniola jurtina TaxID=191418 RepID=UPI001E68655D|nr:zinc finger protein 845-like [Maniola jurtina]